MRSVPQPSYAAGRGAEIIDCHCHAGKGDGLTGPWDTDAPLRDYLARAARAGIQRTIIFAPLSTEYAVGNRWVAHTVHEHPDRLMGFVFVHAAHDRGRVPAIVAEAVASGLVGIKVHHHDAPITREICAVAAAHRLPVVYDVEGEVHVVELLAHEYPTVSFIIPHLSSFADDWRAQRAFLDPLSRHPNVFTDTAGVRRFDLLVEAVHRAGPAKILFGSDGPWLHPGVELAKIRYLGLEPSDESLVLGGNIRRLLGRL